MNTYLSVQLLKQSINFMNKAFFLGKEKLDPADLFSLITPIIPCFLNFSTAFIYRICCNLLPTKNRLSTFHLIKDRRLRNIHKPLLLSFFSSENILILSMRIISFLHLLFSGRNGFTNSNSKKTF